MRNHELEDKLYEYIKDHESDNIDTVSIVNAFSMINGDKIISSLARLKMTRKIERVSKGIYYIYITVK